MYYYSISTPSTGGVHTGKIKTREQRERERERIERRRRHTPKEKLQNE
jgi:hypothetical protein